MVINILYDGVAGLSQVCKRYRYYSYMRLARPLCLAFTISFALTADVIAQQGAENEIFFGRELIERTTCKSAYSIHTFLAPKEQIDALVAYRLNEIINTLALKFAYNLLLIAVRKGVENHASCTDKSARRALSSRSVQLQSAACCFILEFWLNFLHPCINAFIGLIVLVNLVKCKAYEVSVNNSFRVIIGVTIG